MAIDLPILERVIELTITQGKDTHVYSGYRVQARVEEFGGETSAQAQVRIWGLPLAVMNGLTATGPAHHQAIGINTIAIAAGQIGTLHRVFLGTILWAWEEIDQPDAALVIYTTVGALQAVTPGPATSLPGVVSVASLMQTFAQKMGFTFINNGVTAVIRNPHLKGTIWHQARALARQAGIHYAVSGNNIFAIWPQGGTRGGSPLTLSPGGGLVGYPRFTRNRMDIRAIFQPTLQYGAPFVVDGSEITGANGNWTAYTVSHELESQTPDGAWFTNVSAFAHE